MVEVVGVLGRARDHHGPSLALQRRMCGGRRRRQAGGLWFVWERRRSRGEKGGQGFQGLRPEIQPPFLLFLFFPFFLFGYYNS